MLQFLSFSVSRYAGFLSHFAAFLCGLSLWLSLPWGIVLLAVSIVLGSLSAFLRQKSFPPALSADDSSILFSNILDSISKHS